MNTDTYSPQETTKLLHVTFAAPLIISSIGFIIYGINLCQWVEYLFSSKRDYTLTKIWVCFVMTFNSASMVYEVYYNWIHSISAFVYSVGSNPGSVQSITNGNIIVLYSAVVILVQFFWLSCIKKSMASRPKLSWMTITPLAFISLTSFVISIAIGVLARIDPEPNAEFPGPLTSILLRVVLGLDLGVDLVILIVLVSQLTAMRKNTVHHKTTLSKLSWILIGTTIASSLVIIAEIVVELPQDVYAGGPINFAITFAPLIPPIYSFGMLSVLNARSDLWNRNGEEPLQSKESRGGLIPGLRFTRDLSDSKANPMSTFDQPTTTFPHTAEKNSFNVKVEEP